MAQHRHCELCKRSNVPGITWQRNRWRVVVKGKLVGLYVDFMAAFSAWSKARVQQ